MNGKQAKAIRRKAKFLAGEAVTSTQYVHTNVQTKRERTIDGRLVEYSTYTLVLRRDCGRGIYNMVKKFHNSGARK
jgi:hypothetical protein